MAEANAAHVSRLLEDYKKCLEENLKERGTNCVKVATLDFAREKTACGLKEIWCRGCQSTTYFDLNEDEDSFLSYMQRHVMLNHLETHVMTATYVDNEGSTPSQEKSMGKLLKMYEKEDEHFLEYVERYIKAIMVRGYYCTREYGLSHGSKMLCPLGKLIRDTLGYRKNRIEIVGRDTFPFYFCSLCLEIFDDEESHKPHFVIKHLDYKIFEKE